MNKNNIAESPEKIKELRHWVKTFIEKDPQTPPALKNNTIRIKIMSDDLARDDLATTLKGFADNWSDSDEQGKIEVLAVLAPTERYTEEERTAITEEVNNHIMPLSLVALDNHHPILDFLLLHNIVNSIISNGQTRKEI